MVVNKITFLDTKKIKSQSYRHCPILYLNLSLAVYFRKASRSFAASFNSLDPFTLLCRPNMYVTLRPGYLLPAIFPSRIN